MTGKKLPNGMTLVFEPGAFDHFEGTQEELDELVREIEDSLIDGSFLENAQPIDFEDGSWTVEEIEKLQDMLFNEVASKPTLQ